MFILDHQYQHAGPDDDADKSQQGNAADDAAAGAGDDDEDDPSGLGPDDGKNPPDPENDGKDKPTPPAEEIKDLTQAMLDQLELEKGGQPKPKVEEGDDGKPKPKLDADGKPIVEDPKDKDKPKTDAEKKADDEAAAAAIDKEIKDLGIKNPNAQKRFRELTVGLKQKDEQIAGFAKTVGVEPERFAQVLPIILQSANRMAQWDDSVTATGSTPEDFGHAMAVLHSLNSDDIELKRAAYAAVGEIYQRLGDQIGEHADPLAKHPDLKKMVDDGELDPKVAGETAKLRNEKAAAAALSESKGKKNEQNIEAQKAIDKATNDVVAFTSSLAASDPLFDAKFKHLTPVIQRIQARERPETWAARIKEEFDNVAPLFKAPAKDPPRKDPPARVGRVPGRVTGAAHVSDQRPMGSEITDPMQGLASGMMEQLERERRAAGK